MTLKTLLASVSNGAEHPCVSSLQLYHRMVIQALVLLGVIRVRLGAAGGGLGQHRKGSAQPSSSAVSRSLLPACKLQASSLAVPGVRSADFSAADNGFG